MDEVEKPLFVISAVNIFEGGPLTVLKDCLKSANDSFADKYNILAFVHKKDIFSEDNLNHISFCELPKSREHWLYRIYYEYYYFNRISKKIKPYLWLSLHDTSPVLSETTRQCVYCHNPSIFYTPDFFEIRYDKKHFLFSIFYKYLYRINIKKNNFVIVQQNWIRSKFSSTFQIPLSKIVVSYPELPKLGQQPIENFIQSNSNQIFIYAAFPRVFKNYEIIIKAVNILRGMGIIDFEVRFTLLGNENAYAKKIQKLGRNIAQIKFLGVLPREKLLEEYKKCDVLIFPSRLETWGLPITEFKAINKPILLADLEYAHETLGNYDKASFFNPTDAKELARKMASIILDGEKTQYESAIQNSPQKPFTSSWKEMLTFILTH